MRELIGVQNKVFLLGKLSQEAQNGILLVVKNVPGQLPLALLNPSASREAGLLWKQEDRRSHPPALLFIPLLPSGFRASCLPGKPEMQRRGPALTLLEEAVEGQLPDGPVVRSSRVFQLGACGMP